MSKKKELKYRGQRKQIEEIKERRKRKERGERKEEISHPLEPFSHERSQLRRMHCT